MEGIKKYARILLNIIVPLTGILLVCLAGPRLLRFFMPFVVGWVIAVITNPLVRFLESRVNLVRKHGSVIIIVLALGLVIGLGYLLVYWLFIQASGLARDLPELYQVAAEELEEFFRRFDSLFARLPDSIRQAGSEVSGNVGQSIGLLVQRIASPTVEAAGNVAMRIPQILVSVVVTILSAYFFLADREKILGFLRRYLPEEAKRYLHALKEDSWHLLGGYFLAQFKLMFVVAAILLAGFMVLGIPYGLLLAILISLLDFLPILGTGTVLIPWAVVKVLAGEYALAVGLVLLYVMSQVVRQIVQPKIVGDSMGLSPMTTLVLLYLGFKLHGLSGMILAVPLGILGIRLYEYGLFDPMIENIRLLAQEIHDFRKGRQ